MIVVLTLATRAGADDWGELSESVEAARMEALGVRFADVGNAADLYLPYLTGDAEVTSRDWFMNLSLASIEEPDPGDAGELERGIAEAGADLDLMMAASRRRECRVWGVHYLADVDKILFSQNSPEYLNLFKLAVLLIARGDQLAEDEPGSAGADHYLAALRVGHHLEGEPELFGYVVGMALKDAATKRLAQLYQDQGELELAKKFGDYAVLARRRIEAKNRVFQAIPSWKREQVERFVLDPDAPYALRFDTLVSRHYCLHDDPMLIRCALIGCPRWVKALEDEFAKQDDLSGQFVAVMKAHRADLRWLK